MKRISIFMFLFINLIYGQINLNLEKIIALNDTTNPIEIKIRSVYLSVDTINQKLSIYSRLYIQKIGNVILVYNPRNDSLKKIYDTAYFSWGSNQSLVAEGDTFYLYIRNHELNRYDILKFVNYELQNRITIPLKNSALSLAKYDSLFLTIEVPEFNQLNSYIVFLEKRNFQIIKKIPLNRFAGYESRLHIKNNFIYFSSNSTETFFTHCQKINLTTGSVIYNINTPEDTFQSFTNYSVLDDEENLYVAGTKIYVGGLQKFYLYKVSKEGIMEWYREFFPSDIPFKRKNLGNWLNAIEVFGDYIIIGGEVEEYPPTNPRYDPNRRSSYLAIWDKNGYKQKEIFFNTYNFPTYSVDGVVGIKFFNNKLYVLIDALLYSIQHGYVRGIQNLLYVYNILNTKVDNNEVIKNHFNLSQNYPNPFNSKTKIRFSISDFGFTSLKIYDLLGREIATLVNDERAPGEYEIEFDADKYDLSSGVYVYKLVNNSYVQSKKFVLMK